MRTLALSITLLLSPATLLPAQSPVNSGPNGLDSTPAPAAPSLPADATVSVPIHNGDPMTVTGHLALRQRDGQQFLVIESPTPYRLLFPPSAHTAARTVRDIPFRLAGQHQDLTRYTGRTVTAIGALELHPPAPNLWNGALLQAHDVVLPGGKQLHAKR